MSKLEITSISGNVELIVPTTKTPVSTIDTFSILELFIFRLRFSNRHSGVIALSSITIFSLLAPRISVFTNGLLKLPKKKPSKIDDVKQEEYDDIRVICYSVVKKTGIKKSPDLSEIGLSGNLEEKLKFLKENIGKEISVLDILKKGELVDFRGLTKGKGFSGPVKRFGVTLRQHKSEKGRRGPGSIGPWHPARVTFRVPMAGQLGMFTRANYNGKIIHMGKADSDSDNIDKLKNISNFGNIKSDYILVHGSVQGPAKRQLVATVPLRKTKKQSKKNYEFIELR